MQKKCPDCGSKNIELYLYSGAEVMKCKECAFDEGAEFQEFPTEKTSQKAKGRYSPYKAGGSQRARKK